MTRWEGESNESVYERCGMGPCAHGVKCGVVEWVKINTLRCFGHMERKKSEEFVKKVYVSESECRRRRRRPVVRWKDRVKEYMHETVAGLNKQGGSVWIGRGGDSSAVAIPSWGDIPGRNEPSKTIDR